MTGWVSRCVEAVIERPSNVRHLFLTNDKYNLFPVRNSHSHPTAAAYRNAVNIYMSDLAKAAGMEPYNISMSATDKSRGTRFFYTLKDLSIPYVEDEVADTDVLIMCDVDYYADVNEWLKHFRPILIYTFRPSRVAGRTDDYAFRFVDNHVEYRIAGGASYRHELWDYTGDTVSVYDDDENLCVFNIEQRAIAGDDEHRFIAITPLARVPTPEAGLLPPANPLKRLKVTSDDINYLFDPVGDTLSIGRNGKWHSVETTGRGYAAIQARLAHKTSDPVVADVERLLSAYGDKNSATNAPLLFELIGPVLKPNVVPTNGTIISYQPAGPLATEDGKVIGRAISSPLVSNPAVFPNRGYNADVATIKGRIEKVKNVKVPPRSIKNYAHEFVQMVVPRPASGSPISIGDVKKVQSRPAQRARIARCEATLDAKPKNTLKAFVKAEAYGSVTDPRNITTMSPELTTGLSTFTYPFKEDCLKDRKWYGPGYTPDETVKRLREESGPEGWLVVDYSRLDGSVSEFLQVHIVQAAYLRWVNDQDKDQLRYMLQQVFVRRGVTSEGVYYDPGYGTRSGSPITTDGNTMICGFVEYAALRSIGMSQKEAFKSIGLVYGDDGAFRARPGLELAMQATADALGLKIKLDFVEAGRPLPYLGRFFVDPATTDDSFQDPLRTISKLHITANKGVLPKQALVNKASGYVVTDRMTPIIGTWAVKTIEQYSTVKAKGVLKEEEMKAGCAWPQSSRETISEAMAEVLGITVGELLALDRKVLDAATVEQIPVLLDTELEPKIRAVLGDAVVGPESPEPKQAIPDQRQKNGEPSAADSILHPVAGPSGSGSQEIGGRPGPETGGVRTQVHKARPAARSFGRRRDDDRSAKGLRRPARRET